MKRVALVILANSDTQANFLNFRTLKRIGFIDDIHILKENHLQYQFSDHYFKRLGSKPELIIFEYHNSSDYLNLENLKRLESISIIVWGMNHHFSQFQKDQYPNFTFLSQLPKSADILCTLRKAVSNVA